MLNGEEGVEQMQSPSAWMEWIEIIGVQTYDQLLKSPSAWMEWIEMLNPSLKQAKATGLHLHGWSGLKLKSLKARPRFRRLHLHGWSGLKLDLLALSHPHTCLHLHGWSGLKSSEKKAGFYFALSPSAWMEWIEIVVFYALHDEDWSPSAWMEWIEIRIFWPIHQRTMSPSAWMEWIEICTSFLFLLDLNVSICMDGVD